MAGFISFSLSQTISACRKNTVFVSQVHIRTSGLCINSTTQGYRPYKEEITHFAAWVP